MKIEKVEVGTLAPVWDLIVADDLNPQRDGEWFAAYEGTVIVGATHLVEVGPDELFDDLWVHPDHRRKGLGAQLVADVQARRESMWLIADPDRVAYYQKFGFRPRRILPPAIARRYSALGLWPGHLDHTHVAMHWYRPAASGSPTA